MAPKCLKCFVRHSKEVVTARVRRAREAPEGGGTDSENNVSLRRFAIDHDPHDDYLQGMGL